MDMDSLNSFIVLSQYLNYTKAAEALHLTQSALSKRIVKLEEHFGAKLVYRNNRGVFLTAEGQMLLSRAKRMMLDYTNLLYDLSETNQKAKYRLRVGFLGYSVQNFLPTIVREYQTTHPNIEFEFLDGTQKELVEFYLDGRLDILFATEMAENTLRNSRKLLISREPVRLLVPKDSEYATMDAVRLEDLKDKPFLQIVDNFSFLNTGFNPDSLLMRTCSAHGFSPIVHRCRILSNLPLMVACGMGYAITTTATQPFATTHPVAYVPILGSENDTYNIYAYYDELNVAEVEQFVLFSQRFLCKQGLICDTDLQQW